MKKHQPSQSSESSRQERESSPGAGAESALNLGGDVEKALVLDVIQHMKKQNEQQKANNKSQHETNSQLVRVNRFLITLCIVALLLVAEGVFGQIQSYNAISELQRIAQDYRKLHEEFTALKKDMSERLATTPGQVSDQITRLEQKVDDAPKITADTKTGEIKLELPVSPASSGVKVVLPRVSPPTPVGSSSAKATIVLPAPK